MKGVAARVIIESLYSSMLTPHASSTTADRKLDGKLLK